MMPVVLAVSALVVQAPVPAPAAEAVAEAYYLFLQGRRLDQQGDAAGAIAALRRAAALLPRAADIQAELAGVFAREGRAAESMTAAEAALALEPSNREAHRILGFVQGLSADAPANAAIAPTMIAEAIGHLEQALAVPMSDPGARLLLGRLYARTAQHEKAVAAMKAFLADQPGYPDALLLLAESAERVEKWDDAAGAWGQIVDMGSRGRTYRGRHATALVKLGDQHFSAQRYREAADAFDLALKGDRTVFDAAEVTRKRDRARELAGK